MLITYQSGDNRSMINYLTVRKTDRCLVKDVKVISKQVCGMTNGPPRHKETWCNRNVEKVVTKRKVCHKTWRKSKSAEDKHTFDVAKDELYTAVLAAQESKLQELTVDLQS